MITLRSYRLVFTESLESLFLLGLEVNPQ